MWHALRTCSIAGDTRFEDSNTNLCHDGKMADRRKGEESKAAVESRHWCGTDE